MQNSKTFSLEVERLAKEKNITHMEAVLEHCRIQEIEPDSVTRLITKYGISFINASEIIGTPVTNRKCFQ